MSVMCYSNTPAAASSCLQVMHLHLFQL